MTAADVGSLTGTALARALFAPRSIALVGASSDPLKASSRPWGHLRRGGYAGAVYAVNRRGGTIDGEPVYRTVDELPEVPDHAFVMTPTAGTVDAVAGCARAGVRVATVLGGGFAESGAEGVEREQALREAAHEHGMRLLGPNSLGVVNPHRGLRLTANAAFGEPGLPAGGVMVASQSGSLLGALLSRGRARLGFSRMISTGGETDLSLGEICAATVDDDEVSGYLLFLESLRHADRLRAFAEAAAAAGKPVAAYKLGRSRVAAQLARSHTGALAGEDDVSEAFLADCGIARVSTLDGLLEALPLLGVVAPHDGDGDGPGRGVGVVTTTGGGAAMVVDQLGVRGVPVAAPTADTRERLVAAGVDAETGLIVDLTLAGTRPDVMGAALDVLATDPGTAVLVAVVGSSARSQPELAVAPIVERAHRGVPLAVFVVPEAPEALAMLAAAGVPAFRTPESCADVVAAALSRRVPRMRALVPRPSDGVGLDEAASYARLEPLGVPVAPYRVLPVGGPVPDDLAYPVVVKALSDDLVHKSDVGGVVLGVQDRTRLQTAVNGIREALAAPGVGIDLAEVLVQRMQPALGEVLVGYRIDPDAGPLVLVAAGGVLAELHRDRSLRLAPVDLATARAMLDEVTALGALRGYRGAPPGDLDALAELVVRFSRLAEVDDVVEAELNPVLVGPAGQGVHAVDAVVRVRRHDALEER